jgi:hypothetical protein
LRIVSAPMISSVEWRSRSSVGSRTRSFADIVRRLRPQARDAFLGDAPACVHRRLSRPSPSPRLRRSASAAAARQPSCRPSPLTVGHRGLARADDQARPRNRPRPALNAFRLKIADAIGRGWPTRPPHRPLIRDVCARARPRSISEPVSSFFISSYNSGPPGTSKFRGLWHQ